MLPVVPPPAPDPADCIRPADGVPAVVIAPVATPPPPPVVVGLMNDVSTLLSSKLLLLLWLLKLQLFDSVPPLPLPPGLGTQLLLPPDPELEPEELFFDFHSFMVFAQLVFFWHNSSLLNAVFFLFWEIYPCGGKIAFHCYFLPTFFLRYSIASRKCTNFT